MPETTTQTTLEEKIKVKQDALKALITPAEGAEPVTAEALKAASAELMDLHTQRKTEAEAAKAKDILSWLDEVDPSERPPQPADTDPAAKAKQENAGKSAGEIFTESPVFKNYAYGSASPDVRLPRSLEEMRYGPVTKAARMEAAIKALFSTSAGFAPDSPRGPEIVGAIHRPVQLLDRLRQVSTTLDTIKWMLQTVRTAPSDTDTAEGATYAEATLTYAQQSASIEKKTVWVPVTEEQLADVPFIQDVVSAQLPAMLGESIDHDIINGAGSTGDQIGLESFNTRLTRTKAADESAYAAIVRGIGDVQTDGRATPDLVLMRTVDWIDMILEQGANGNYIFGMLANQGQSPFGIPVVYYDSLSAGQYIVGDFARYMMIRDRQDFRTRIAPQYDSSGSDTAPQGTVMIFSDVRVQNQWLRPQAFCDITS